jgi:hypothetical protein
MELVVYWPAEDHVVGNFQGHNLKYDHLLTVIVNITEGRRKFDAAQGVCLFTRNHTIEFCGVVLKLFLGKVHLLQSFQIHDVQVGTAIHGALGEVIPVNAGLTTKA